MNISYSRVASYMSCPYAHYLGYELGIVSAKPIKPLYFGTNFHKLLELRHDEKALAATKQEITDTYYSVPAQWQSELGENYLENLFSIFDDYCEIYKDESKPSVTEQEFELFMFTLNTEPCIFKGKIDEVYKRKSKKTGEKFIKVGEHKTFNYRPDNNTLVMNAQKYLYAKAIEILYGITPKSVIWDYIHSTPAPAPVWLESSKRFSASRSNDITDFSYIRACKEHDIEPDKRLVEQYKNNRSTHFYRVEQDYNPDAIDSVWNGFKFQAQLVVQHGAANQTKNLTRNCSYCQYRDLCFTELSQGNLTYLLQKQYQVKPRVDIQTEWRQNLIDNSFINLEIQEFVMERREGV